MPTPQSPTDAFDALVRGVSERRLAELPSLYAADTDVTHPFDPGRSPVLRTRDDLRAHFERNAALAPDLRREPANVTIHETADPEVIVAEFEYRCTAPTADGPFTVPASSSCACVTARSSSRATMPTISPWRGRWAASGTSWVGRRTDPRGRW